MELFLLVAFFVAVVGVLIGGFIFANRKQLERSASARARLLHLGDAAAATESILKDTSASSFPMLDRLLSGRPLTAELRDQLERAGLDMKPGAFVLTIGVSAAFGYLIGTTLVPGLVGSLGIVAGFLAPILWLRMKQRKRIRQFQEQLPEAIDMLVSAMRAGYSFQAAMKFIGEEVAAPLGPEFARFYEEQRLGMEVRVALLAMQERMDSLDLKMLVTAILIQRETGGNLSEVLSNIAFVMRERSAIRGEIETLTAESKLSARILAVLPVLVFMAVYAMDPTYMSVMLTQTLGQIMIAIGVISILTGYTTMMKIADVDI